MSAPSPSTPLPSAARSTRRLAEAVSLSPAKLLNPELLNRFQPATPDTPILILLAAGKGTRFGQSPKCAQPVCGIPLARHSLIAFHALSPQPALVLVGHRHLEVIEALGDDNLYVLSDHPAGGTAFAAYEAFSVPHLADTNPLLVITMGDRIVPTSTFQRLLETHCLGPTEADLTLLSALYEPPKHRGKGRIARDLARRVIRIVEQRDIDHLPDPAQRQALDQLTEGNCPLYAIRAATLRHELSHLTNDNAQHQFYLTDIVESISRRHGDIRTITTSPAEPEFDLLCSDVTRPRDLALLEGILSSSPQLAGDLHSGVDEAARRLAADRPPVQTAAIAAQLEELLAETRQHDLGLRPDLPVALGVSGGRLRIAFMHPDMGRFYGPAWQTPLGAGQPTGREQIVVLVQVADDGKIHLHPTEPEYREKLDFVPADAPCMYPGQDVHDWSSYEGFGTRMAENLLLSLGYFSDEEIQARQTRSLPLPPPSLWLSNSLRRPISLVGNAIASLRTLREGNLGARVQTYLGRDGFQGLRVLTTGAIPRGGFSSSSAVTLAVKNAINALFNLGLSPDLLVHLACQAEYGTGVRAGSLDQATEQKGRPNQGTLISSNPRDNYRTLGVYPAPTHRFRVLFPYSVDRDRAAWKWSAGAYAPSPEEHRLTTTETRKMTGKSAEIAALLTRLPLDTDFFAQIQDDLLTRGALGPERTRWVYDQLLQLPLHATQTQLRALLAHHRPWHISQLAESQRLTIAEATERTDAAFAALFAGWRDPLLPRPGPDGALVTEPGAPLRAMLAYLFGEVAKNFHLIHHPDQWIPIVTSSQQGDRSFTIPLDRLPPAADLLRRLDWETHLDGPALLDAWLQRVGAQPFDYNRGLDDDTLRSPNPGPLHALPGGSFFRGLALIDVAEAMLKRAFGDPYVAVRVNAAGQGDYFQVHFDTLHVSENDLKDFIRQGFYARFHLAPTPPFVETYPGGGATGVRLSRFDLLPELIRRLGSLAGQQFSF